MYELCRLGVHRPALRIAPEHGLIRVPMYGSRANAHAQMFAGVKVDGWFDRIQLNKSSRFIGKQLKMYAKCLKSLALRIRAGHTSTITTTIESTFFEPAPASSTLSNSAASTVKQE